MLFENTFFGKGENVGPNIVMTVYSSAEHSAIQEVRHNEDLLLCNFTFCEVNGHCYIMAKTTSSNPDTESEKHGAHPNGGGVREGI